MVTMIPTILPTRWNQHDPFFYTDYDPMREDWWHASTGMRLEIYEDGIHGKWVDDETIKHHYTLDVGCGEDMKYHCQLIKDGDWEKPVSYFAYYQVSEVLEWIKNETEYVERICGNEI